MEMPRSTAGPDLAATHFDLNRRCEPESRTRRDVAAREPLHRFTRFRLIFFIIRPADSAFSGFILFKNEGMGRSKGGAPEPGVRPWRARRRKEAVVMAEPNSWSLKR
jgi:hypothetical protein